jgi:hypothetical protein
MKREEAVAQVRLIAKTCRGNPLIDEAKREELHKRWADILKEAEPLPKALEFVKEVEDLAKISHPAEGEAEGLHELTIRAATALFAYDEKCGYDFNEIIIAGPFDGQQHEYTCPKCRQKGTYRAPYFEITE